MGSAGQLLELIVSREGKQEEEGGEGEARWGRRKMGRRGKPAVRGNEDDSEELEEGEIGVFGSMGLSASKESMMGGTLPRGNQKGRSGQANEKLSLIQNTEKSCSAQKNVATERTILESGGHQVPYFSLKRILPQFCNLINLAAAAAHLSAAASISTFSASCQLNVCSTSLSLSQSPAALLFSLLPIT